MRANPEPNDEILVLTETNSPIAAANSSREHRLLLVNTLEVKAGMMWVLDEELI